MEFTKTFIQKHSKIIVIIDIILLIFSIGFGNSGVLNGMVTFLLFLLLGFMPEEAFDDESDSCKEDKK